MAIGPTSLWALEPRRTFKGLPNRSREVFLGREAERDFNPLPLQVIIGIKFGRKFSFKVEDKIQEKKIGRSVQKQELKISPITLTQDKCFAITAAAKLIPNYNLCLFLFFQTYSVLRRQMVSVNIEKSS